MNENLDLCKILKGHEGKYFWSPFFGRVKLLDVRKDEFVIEEYDYPIPSNGIVHNGGDLMFYPSKIEKDWHLWNTNVNGKTWINLKKTIPIYSINLIYKFDNVLDKSLSARFKIYKVIEKYYGGNPTYKDKIKGTCFKISYDINANEFTIFTLTVTDSLVCFYTRKQAEEFLSYIENIKLLKELYGIN